MARWRGIDTDIWQNPSFRKLSDRAQKVFLYLITAADDEGRVVLDAEAILDGAWHRSSNIRPREVEKALAEVQGTPLICVYAGVGCTCAFLPGWFEHQPEQATGRDESTLPPPPLDEVISWRAAKAVKAEYCAETGASAQGTYLRNALAWHRGKKSQSSESQVAVESDSSKSREEESKEEESRGEGGLGGAAIPIAPQRLSVGAANAAPTPVVKKLKRTTVSDEALEAEATRLLGEMPARFRSAIEVNLSNVASTNKTKVITAGRRVTELTSLEGTLRKYGPERFGRALEKTNRRGKGPEYVRGICRNEAAEEDAGLFDAGAQAHRPEYDEPWNFRAPLPITDKCHLWEDAIYNADGKRKTALETAYHAAHLRFRDDHDAEAFPIPEVTTSGD